ncbi:sensor histidine kinase [Paenibacillus methanolicus]|uniref:histidine kinase n=1 Tax=Paenibacillus methanolicus TaxID=582686 RepID=A0A5S5BU78_9BACL|nr:sensor histidine kinase [Paenibacillus methanolicus]TYP69710.1 signal transduction histidine kinase [Paenibacillus methanolicus]
MKFWRFLSYERPHLLVLLSVVAVVALVFMTDPSVSWRWSTVLYACALALLIAAGYTLYRYAQSASAIRRMDEEETRPLSMEAAAYREAMEQMERRHILALNEAKAQQLEHYHFVVSWFHEIKTPISVLRLMQQTRIDPASLEEELTRIEHYVDQALYYAKLDSFSQDYEIGAVELEPFMKGIVRRHAKTFISRKIRIEFRMEPRLTVQSDPKWLQFIADQVITNSLKYTGEHGEIVVSTRAFAQEKQLVIRDNGIGIEAKDMPRVFNRGFTGTNGRQAQAKSTGMGLYLAQELSNRLGHYMTCSSVAGAYTEMVIHFPKHHDPHWMMRRGDRSREDRD